MTLMFDSLTFSVDGMQFWGVNAQGIGIYVNPDAQINQSSTGWSLFLLGKASCDRIDARVSKWC